MKYRKILKNEEVFSSRVPIQSASVNRELVVVGFIRSLNSKILIFLDIFQLYLYRKFFVDLEHRPIQVLCPFLLCFFLCSFFSCSFPVALSASTVKYYSFFSFSFFFNEFLWFFLCRVILFQFSLFFSSKCVLKYFRHVFEKTFHCILLFLIHLLGRISFQLKKQSG